MKKLVTISRQYGSGGRKIGKILADILNVPFYDKEIIDLAVEESGYSREVIEGAEMKAKSGFAYSLASALSFTEGGGASRDLSVNDRLFLAQYKVIQEIGNSDMGVIIGRCADYVLKDKPDVTNVFIYGELEDRIRRAVTEYGEDPENAKNTVLAVDKARANYYNYHTEYKYGDVRNYNLCINSSYITEQEAAELIADYVEKRKYIEEA
ncbi:MAG: cytidylate kinase-like family protein [Firmicutes bacterium]|nr:cytidylate kinase-like family protein [Bacillota bacterium]